MKATAYYFSDDLKTSLVNYGRISKGSDKLMVTGLRTGIIRDNSTLVIIDDNQQEGGSRYDLRGKGGQDFKCIHTLRGSDQTLACDSGVLIPKGAKFERRKHSGGFRVLRNGLAILDKKTSTLSTWSIPKDAKKPEIGVDEKEELFLLMKMIFERSLHVLKNRTHEPGLLAEAMLLTVECIVFRANDDLFFPMPDKYFNLITCDVLNLFDSRMNEVWKKLYDLLELGKRTTEKVNFPEEYFGSITRYRGYPFSARIQRTSPDDSLFSVFVGPDGSNYVASQFEFIQSFGKSRVHVERII